MREHGAFPFWAGFATSKSLRRKVLDGHRLGTCPLAAPVAGGSRMVRGGTERQGDLSFGPAPADVDRQAQRDEYAKHLRVLPRYVGDEAPYTLIAGRNDELFEQQRRHTARPRAAV